jgi:hypothetical protein
MSDTLLSVAGLIGSSLNLNTLVLAVLDPVRPLPVAVCGFPVNPESYRELNRYLSNVTSTLGGGFVDRAGVAPGSIALAGRFPRKPHVTSYLLPVPMDDAQAVQYLRYVCELAETPDANGRSYRTVLMNWLTGRHWEVVVDALEITQSIGRNTIWLYSLQLRAVRPIMSVWRSSALGVPLELAGQTVLGKISAGLASWLSAAAAGVGV